MVIEVRQGAVLDENAIERLEGDFSRAVAVGQG